MASGRAKANLEILGYGGPGPYDDGYDVVRYRGPNYAGRGRFTSKMALVVASLARGESSAEAAAHAGVSRRTVLRWKHRPEFVAGLDRWVRDRALVAGTLRAVLVDPDAHPRLKLRAARLAMLVKDRRAASNRVDDLIARDVRIANAVISVQQAGGGREGA